MNLFLVTDEFLVGVMGQSFRAIVTAADESSARWVVASSGKDVPLLHVQQSVAINIGTIEHTRETVLAFSVRQGWGDMRKTSGEVDVHPDRFYRLVSQTVADPLTPLQDHPDRLNPNTVSYWFSTSTKLIMRLTERDTKLPNFTGTPGVYSEKESYAQFFYPAHDDAKPDYAPTEMLTVEHYTQSFLTLGEAHTVVSRLAQVPMNVDGTRELLGELWTKFVTTGETSAGSVVNDLDFYEGQKLWFMADKARKWLYSIPHCIALERNLKTDFEE